MFGITRRKATATAIQATFPIIKTLEISGPLPSQFWSNPYALGYLYWTIGAFAKAATSGKVAGQDMGRCLIDTFTKISGRNGSEITRLTTDMASQQVPDFVCGMRDAEKVIAVTYGSRDFDNDPDVISAVAIADAMGNSLDFLGSSDRRTKIAGALGTIVNNRIKRRLGIAA